MVPCLSYLVDMDLSVLKASDSSSTEMITQYFEVTDCKGRKVVNDKTISNVTKVLRRVKMEWISESLVTSIAGNAIVQMHNVEFVAEGSADLLGDVSRLLVSPNYRVHSAGCWTRKGRVECVIYVEGARTVTLLWELRHIMEFGSCSTRRANVFVHRVAAEEFSHLNKRLHNLKRMELGLPRSSSIIRLHQRKGYSKGFYGPVGVVCLGKPEPLVRLSGTLADMNYKIWEAFIDFPGPYEFLKGKANKSELIFVGTRGNKEMGNMKKFLYVAIERGCPEVNVQLIFHGPRDELHDDLVRSLCENGLFVTGGQIYRDDDVSRPEALLFVTENPAAGAG